MNADAALKDDAERLMAEARDYRDRGNHAASCLLFGQALGIVWALWRQSHEGQLERTADR